MSKIKLNDIDYRDKGSLCNELVRAYLNTSDCAPADKDQFNRYYEDSGAPKILKEYQKKYAEMGYDLEYTPDEAFDLYITIMT